MPKCSVTSRCWASTSSTVETGGKCPRSNGTGVVDGELDIPPPSWPGQMTKQRCGSSGRPSPMCRSSDDGVPEYPCGKSTALSRASFSVPCVR